MENKFEKLNIVLMLILDILLIFIFLYDGYNTIEILPKSTHTFLIIFNIIIVITIIPLRAFIEEKFKKNRLTLRIIYAIYLAVLILIFQALKYFFS